MSVNRYSRNILYYYEQTKYAQATPKLPFSWGSVLVPALSALGGALLGGKVVGSRVNRALEAKFRPFSTYGSLALYGAIPGALLGFIGGDTASGALLGSLGALGLGLAAPDVVQKFTNIKLK